MNNHPWHSYCLQEIESKVSLGKKKLNPWELEFFKTVKTRIERGIGLTDKQEQTLVKLHERVTELSRIKW